MKNAFTYQRVTAYLIDIILIGILSTLITNWIPESETYKNVIKNQNEYYEEYQNKEIEINEYVDKMYETYYTLDKETVIQSMVTVVITFAYFATFAYYFGGQTLGKKLLHIKVVNEDGKDATHLQLALRALIINECFFSIVSLIMLFIIKSNQYLYTVGLVNLIQSLIVIISLLMIIIRNDKKGLHDILKVVEV